MDGRRGTTTLPSAVIKLENVSKVYKGDVVALLMPNRPEYVTVWLGVAKIGGVTALLNTNLTGASLAHCMNVVNARIIVVDAALLPLFDTAKPHLAAGVKLFIHGEKIGRAHV